jgi:hypothetical protein
MAVDKRIIIKISDSQRDENVVFSDVMPRTLSDGYLTVRGNDSLRLLGGGGRRPAVKAQT